VQRWWRPGPYAFRTHGSNAAALWVRGWVHEFWTGDNREPSTRWSAATTLLVAYWGVPDSACWASYVSGRTREKGQRRHRAQDAPWRTSKN